ncbi:type II toxin-antitoxin system RelE/ParE family toxin [Okeania sp.]|uniref:type II toxin-antitoxin system RelE family toxin n=1 Tax=Okeania sp. TaxID=3100323 RepID=UPI002B4AE17A|nr:type II toxin-antitoxin system RelE/ParE family toxin [Okeania sp.]MEB3340855.1 type II toxin-antitoxin system RelE/ParE family toxin [Okeania sp.]
MQNEANPVYIIFSDEFEERLYRLSKKYRHVRSDIQPIIEEIQTGNFLGDCFSGIGEELFIFKVRVQNSNIQIGESDGYRLIYQVESDTRVLLLTIYSKTGLEDISSNEIRSILAEFYV